MVLSRCGSLDVARDTQCVLRGLYQRGWVLNLGSEVAVALYFVLYVDFGDYEHAFMPVRHLRWSISCTSNSHRTGFITDSAVGRAAEGKLF